MAAFAGLSVLGRILYSVLRDAAGTGAYRSTLDWKRGHVILVFVVYSFIITLGWVYFNIHYREKAADLDAKLQPVEELGEDKHHPEEAGEERQALSSSHTEDSET